mmetsp:Transcript_4370/g.10696  ORF Transcript_4370/g.10696 Transcript_4370/m.10696 type:complete len:246 (+) Transcript_4370:3525-4262(+)
MRLRLTKSWHQSDEGTPYQRMSDWPPCPPKPTPLHRSQSLRSQKHALSPPHILHTTLPPPILSRTPPQQCQGPLVGGPRAFPRGPLAFPRLAIASEVPRLPARVANPWAGSLASSPCLRPPRVSGSKLHGDRSGRRLNVGSSPCHDVGVTEGGCEADHFIETRALRLLYLVLRLIVEAQVEPICLLRLRHSRDGKEAGAKSVTVLRSGHLALTKIRKLVTRSAFVVDRGEHAHDGSHEVLPILGL